MDLDCEKGSVAEKGATVMEKIRGYKARLYGSAHIGFLFSSFILSKCSSIDAIVSTLCEIADAA